MVAGQNTKITRDGTPKKYFTLSFDDGIIQDRRVLEILRKYGAYCATFNINTAYFGYDNSEFIQWAYKCPSLTHIRLTEDEVRGGIYDGFELAVHTLHHPSLKVYDTAPDKIREEICGDAENIERLCGIYPIGMAWPGGDGDYTDITVKHVYENTPVRYARGSTSTYSFDLPDTFLKWYPTCSFLDGRTVELTRKFLEAKPEKDMLFYVWAHSYEFDVPGARSYGEFDEFIKAISSAEDVVLLTNAEFYQLFKDEIPSV